MSTLSLYLLTVLLSATTTAIALPLLRAAIGPALLDSPGGLKHHAQSTPIVGGCALLAGLIVSLFFIRYTTDFPTGTLHSLRGILCGGAMIFGLGLLDDLKKPAGLGISVKLFIQILATLCLMRYGVHISLFDSPVLSYTLTFLWVLGITNAFNLLDIADGLCVGQAVICCLGLIFISLPSEQIYVNFGAYALLGACLGFWPYNHSRRLKSFLGDSGSTLIGFLIAALSMGADYSTLSNVGFLAPLLILAVPIFDTSFVSLVRLQKGQNPLQGSPDHAVIRLQRAGISPKTILLSFLTAGVLFNILAFWTTRLTLLPALCVYGVALLLTVMIALYLIGISGHTHD
ncbi:MAG: undecaprenyl/decaprenyl-phosphate alpha-N-acetylglucosaminyl 1-phosphate transferase [Elusimicrobiaceae bacterium]|nr:undecaprenyl/decaprenyl-phosphate alpha-N-acetylglucosaminyl 1-phosphate transferase [Elusimicrobiaceae bacterium]